MIITGIEKDSDLALMKAKLLGSLLYFTQVFFKVRTGREFVVSQPIGRESHHITICRELMRAFKLEVNKLIINVPPGHSKSTLLHHFVAWAWAHYPDCQFIYLSYSHDEAARNTGIIKSIISLPEYRRFFGVEVDQSSSARDDFKTTKGGTCKAFGSDGAVTGKDAGFPNCTRFSGATLMDDMHKPKEVHSDVIREGVFTNYLQTIAQRKRGPNVLEVFQGQRLHEEDVPGKLIRGMDGHKWSVVILKALDEHGNVLDPNIRSKEELLKMQEHNEYTFWAQYQQDPQPASGGIFKVDNFWLMDEEPACLATFITVDTAETDKDWNDATAFSFWGLYKINDFGRVDSNQYALHWINCWEIRVEPKHLKNEFMNFYLECSLYPIPPYSIPPFVAIEKKSTGVTLLSVLGDIRGLAIRDIDRTKRDKNKTARYFEIQPFINQKLVSLPRYGKHTHLCIEHCRKITANGTHAHDDICDTLYDGIKIGLIDKLLIKTLPLNKESSALKEIAAKFKRINQLKDRANGYNRFGSTHC
jgi:hypothetical protein